LARTKVGTFQASRCRHSLAGLTSWMRFLVSPHPEQIADARVGSRCTIRPSSLRVVSITRQPLATRSCPVRMRRSIPPIRRWFRKQLAKQEGCSSSAARSARPPALAAAALSHAPRRGPGAPQAPSEASLPWTATQAAWHHAATAAPAIMPPRPSPESANTRMLIEPRLGATYMEFVSVGPSSAGALLVRSLRERSPYAVLGSIHVEEEEHRSEAGISAGTRACRTAARDRRERSLFRGVAAWRFAFSAGGVLSAAGRGEDRKGV